MAGNITVKGGKKLTRFIREVTDPEFELAILSKVLRQYIVPMLKRFAPRRTGRLRRSVRVVRRGATLEVRGAFYGHLVKFSYKGQPVTMPELTVVLIVENKARVRELYRQAIRNAARG